MTGFSYSSIKTFEQCPKKYYHLKVAKDVHDAPGEAANYGSAVHKAAEDHVTLGTPVPKKYDYMIPIMAPLLALEGDKYAELELGILRFGEGYMNKAFGPCDFDDPNHWWHGIADLLVVNGELAWCVDYKTGKNARYADLRQLDLLAAGVFLRFPQVQTIKSALLYVVSDEFRPKDHHRMHLPKYLATFDRQLEARETAERTGVWNANSGPLCGWCPVESCPHWTDRRSRR